MCMYAARIRSECKTKPRHTTINKWIQFNYMTRGAATHGAQNTKIDGVCERESKTERE